MALRLAEKLVEPARRLFGTDGIRGTANVYPMTGELMLQLGRALAYLIKRGNHRHRVVNVEDCHPCRCHPQSWAVFYPF